MPPSRGDPTPSRADVEMTQAIIDMAKPLGIAVHDHIIVGKQGHASLKGLRLTFDPREEPGALAAHAGICAGGGQQWPSLPRPSLQQTISWRPDHREHCTWETLFGPQP